MMQRRKLTMASSSPFRRRSDSVCMCDAKVLLEIGGFDTERFGRGYGEENDFCLRARRQGYRNVLAGDVFVGHEGGASFTHEKQQLIDEGLAELDQLYPDYRSEINDFLERDPVRRLRRRIDVGPRTPKRARRNFNGQSLSRRRYITTRD